jgi:DNA primase
MLRILLEYGQRRWDESNRVADFIFGELDGFRFDHPDMEDLFETYLSMHRNGQEPDIKTLLYHDRENIRNLVVQLTVTPFELSQKWDEVLETTHVVNKDTSVQDVIMSLCFFKLRKIKRMFEENQRDMENAGLEDQLRLIEVHKHLKEIEKDLTRQLGTVIIK